MLPLARRRAETIKAPSDRLISLSGGAAAYLQAGLCYLEAEFTTLLPVPSFQIDAHNYYDWGTNPLELWTSPLFLVAVARTSTRLRRKANNYLSLMLRRKANNYLSLMLRRQTMTSIPCVEGNYFSPMQRWHPGKQTLSWSQHAQSTTVYELPWTNSFSGGSSLIHSFIVGPSSFMEDIIVGPDRRSCIANSLGYY